MQRHRSNQHHTAMSASPRSDAGTWLGLELGLGLGLGHLEAQRARRVEVNLALEVEAGVVVEAEEEVGLVAVVEEVWSAPSQAARG